MDLLFDVPWLSDGHLRQKAREFLRRHHPDDTIPVPIEEIAEFQLNLHIVPVQGLHREHDLDGLLANTLDLIWVDRFFFDKRPARHRFTLAHEIAHLLLHPQVYRAAPSEITKWKEFLRSIPEATTRDMDYQANRVAGLILLPFHHLRSETQKAVRVVISKGIDFEEHWDVAWKSIAGHLAKQFFVSSQCASRALKVEGVKDSYRSPGR